jgi:imidazolonepropionase
MTTNKQTNSALLLVNIGQLLTLQGEDGPRRGQALGELCIIEDGAVLCAGGNIVSVGTTKEAVRDGWVKQHKKGVTEIDCEGKVVLPGFVDSHTHPVFAAPRLMDFEKRIAGATYEEIAEAGGGIQSSIEPVREISKAELSRKILRRFQEMASYGTTTIEAKSGYGLNVESELKSLEAIRDAAKQFPGTIVPTLLGAHVVPPELRQAREEYIRLICEEMIPQVDERGLAWFVDVFCERGAFTADEAEIILTAAWQHNMGARVHVCQLTPASLHSLMKFDPASVDHMDCVRDEDIEELAQTKTVASLLPAANYFLGHTEYPPARKLIDAGVAVSLATDYNPGTSPTPSMPFVLSLACTHMKMQPAEAITAATINAAHAVRMAEQKGSIEPGKHADMAIFDVEDYREIPYWIGVNRCKTVIIGGEVVNR